MSHWSMRRGLLLATCIAALSAGMAQAQSNEEDAFSAFRKAPVELEGLFRNRPVPRLELPEAVRQRAETRVKRGGTGRAGFTQA